MTYFHEHGADSVGLIWPASRSSSEECLEVGGDDDDMM